MSSIFSDDTSPNIQKCKRQGRGQFQIDTAYKNEQIILRIIYEYGPRTQAQLVKQSGLSLRTVQVALKRMQPKLITRMKGAYVVKSKTESSNSRKGTANQRITKVVQLIIPYGYPLPHPNAKDIKKVTLAIENSRWTGSLSKNLDGIKRNKRLVNTDSNTILEHPTFPIRERPKLICYDATYIPSYIAQMKKGAEKTLARDKLEAPKIRVQYKKLLKELASASELRPYVENILRNISVTT